VKEYPTRDYPVRVLRRQWEEPEPAARFYTGIYDVVLNGVVTVTFIPDPGTTEFDHTAIPANIDEVATEQQARLVAVLFADYAVIPDRERAGSTASVPPADQDGLPGVVFYIDPTQFARLTADLAILTDPDATVSRLRGHPAVDFVEHVVASPEFAPVDAYWLRDPE
jgi:hypothetical protein